MIDGEIILDDAAALVEVASETVVAVLDSAAGVIEAAGSQVVVATPALHIVAVAEQGPPGAQGVPGPTGGIAMQHVAGTALGGHRMVVLSDAGQAVYADAANLAHAHKVLGMTTGAVVAGDIATIQSGGEIAEPSWAWTLGVPVWLAANGLLAQSPPVVGFSLIVGFPLSATTLFVGLREPILLNQE